jgi:hypothetical protein
MKTFETTDPDHESPNYRLCPHCTRTVHASSNEQYCINDGNRMLEACPVCDSKINSPYACYCTNCGCDMGGTQTGFVLPEPNTSYPALSFGLHCGPDLISHNLKLEP